MGCRMSAPEGLTKDLIAFAACLLLAGCGASISGDAFEQAKIKCFDHGGLKAVTGNTTWHIYQDAHCINGDTISFAVKQ